MTGTNDGGAAVKACSDDDSSAAARHGRGCALPTRWSNQANAGMAIGDG